MSRNPQPRIARDDLARLTTFRMLPNLTKLPLFVGLMIVLTWVAWTSNSWVVTWSAYVALGYLWMSIVTFMHDATHSLFCKSQTLSWAFGITAMLPIFASFVAFKEDHLEHHRHNRSPRDPDAFTMGKRGVLDFVLFYAYMLIGAVLSFVHFNILYPISRFNRRLWAIHLFETALKVLVYWLVLSYAERHGVLTKALEVWLWPVFFFSLLNSMRFIAEHYGTPWDSGQMAGTRTVTSNPVHSFFWNNINWHIGHHVYPGVPWYNLVELHGLLASQIDAGGGVVDKSYVAVCFDALRSGPETAPRLAQTLARRSAAKERLHGIRTTSPVLKPAGL
jgi:fatty acid desaturase